MARSGERRPAAPASAQLDPSRFEVVRFEVVPPQRSGTVLGLSLHAPFELSPRSRPTLIVVRDEVELLHTPRMAASSRHELAGGGTWLWRGMFPVAADLAGDVDALFSLRLFDTLTIGLPAPVQLPAAAALGDDRRGRRWPYAVRRGALLFVVSCQLSLLPAIASPGALAEGTPGAGTPTEAAPEPPPGPPGPPPGGQPGETPSQPPAEGPSPQPPGAGEGGGGGGAHPGEAPGAKSPGGTSGAPAAAPRDGASGQPVTVAPSDSAPATSRAGGERASRAPAESLSVTIDRGSPSGGHAHGGTPGAADKGARAHGKRAGARDGKRAHGRAGQDGEGGVLVGSPPGQAVEGDVPPAGTMEVPAGLFALPPGLDALGENPPPGYLIPIYREAGRRYGVPWQVLAAINEIETNYGRNLNVSSAGALGWMQFMPGTWAQWGVDADHDGARNPYSPLDAIFAAARYLKASGAQRDLPTAVYVYNHAHWYVTEVLLRARMLEHDLAAEDGSQKGYALPLDRRYMAPLGRTDDGVDIETAPDGALVYSMTPGVVSAVASDPGGFGPNYPVVEATGGSLAGQHIYYGHVAASLVRPGQRVAAGQPIAVMGHTGDAVSLAHGHIEIGFSDAGGNPLNHHGAEAWTPAGAVMRSVLVTLSDALHVRNG